MKMKKMTTLMLAAALAMAMAGCAQKPAETQAPATEAPATEAAAEAPAETEAPEEEEQMTAGFDLTQLDKYNMYDISHLVTDDMPADPALKLPSLDFFCNIGENDALYNLEVISYCPHTGTHMDSPHHVIQEMGTVETIDPEVLLGPAAILHLDVPEGSYAITVEDITNWEAEHGEIQEGEAVLFDTGHDKHWEEREYYITEYPYLDVKAAEYLADKGARYIAMPSISPDNGDPVSHQALLSKGTEVVENICNLDQIEADHCYTVGTFANVQGSTGVWVRILAYVEK